jgi:hypothetical protein
MQIKPALFIVLCYEQIRYLHESPSLATDIVRSCKMWELEKLLQKSLNKGTKLTAVTFCWRLCYM